MDDDQREPDKSVSTASGGRDVPSDRQAVAEGSSDVQRDSSEAGRRHEFETRVISDAERLQIEKDLRRNDVVAGRYLWTEALDQQIGTESLNVAWWTDEVVYAAKPIHGDEYAMRMDDKTGRSMLDRKLRVPKDMLNGSSWEDHARSKRLPGNEDAFRVIYDPLLADGSSSSTRGPRCPVHTQDSIRLGSDSVVITRPGSAEQKGPLAGAEDSPNTDFTWICIGVTGERLILPRLFISSGCLDHGQPIGISKMHVVELNDAMVVRVQSGYRVHEVIWSMRINASDRNTKTILVPPSDTALANTLVKTMEAFGHKAMGNLELVVVNTQRQVRCSTPFCEYRGSLTVPTDVRQVDKGTVYVVSRGNTTGLSTEPGLQKWLTNLVARGGVIGGCKPNENCPVVYSQPTISTVSTASSPTVWKFRDWAARDESPSSIKNSFPKVEFRTPLSYAESKNLYNLGSPLDAAEVKWLQVVDTTSMLVRNLRKNERYVAVSYTWADYDDGEILDMVVTVKAITEASAVWIDRLCLPQDEPMRQSALNSMGAVYGRAALVVVMLTKMQSRLRTSIRDEDQIFNWRVDREANAEFLQEYCARGWRTRVWTAQEGILGGTAIAVTADCVTWLGYLEALAADHMMGWGDMTHVSLASNDDSIVVSARTHFTGPHAFTNTMFAGGGHLRGVRRRVWTLAEAARTTTGRKCSKEEDRIYGILGLLGEKGDSIVWKYGSGWKGALLEVAKVVGISPMWLTTTTASPRSGMCWMPDSLENLEKAVSANVFHELESEAVLRVTDNGVEVEGATSAGTITALHQDRSGDDTWLLCKVSDEAVEVL